MITMLLMSWVSENALVSAEVERSKRHVKCAEGNDQTSLLYENGFDQPLQ